MSARGKLAIEGHAQGLLTYTQASGVLRQELGIDDPGAVKNGGAATLSAKTINESVVLTLPLDEAETLAEYLDTQDSPPAFRLANRSLYEVLHVVKDAVRDIKGALAA